MVGRLLTVASLLLMVGAQEQTTATDMGPTAFMWPPDRTWSADKDNTAPCGTSSGVGNRAQFPLRMDSLRRRSGGAIALVDQTESWNVQVALSYRQDPESNDDFLVVISAARLADFDPGHKCLSFPDPKAGTEAGANATIQLRYLSEFDVAANQTFYACADITYAADFAASIPCFNVSIDDPTAVTSAAPKATRADSLQTGGSLCGPRGKSHVGAIVGGVVGGVAGLALVAVGLVLFRRRQKSTTKKRQQESTRRVQWGDQFKSRTSSSQGSQNSIRLEYLDR